MFKSIRFTSNHILLSLVLLSLVFLSGCSIVSDRKAVYVNSQTTKSLEVPPDLAQPESRNNFNIPDIAPNNSNFATDATDTVSTNTNMAKVQLQRDGATFWLEITASPEFVWVKSIAFLEDLGFEIVYKNPNSGVMQTDWLENRAGIPTGFLADLVSIAYDSGLRDKYRIRIERSSTDKNVTLMFITHRGLEEVAYGDDNISVPTIVWVPRDTDPELEIEMLQLFLVQLGMQEAEAQGVASKEILDAGKRTEIIKNEEQTVLKVNQIFPRTWRLTGLALDRLGFLVEDRNRSQGIYYIEISEEFIESQEDEQWFESVFGSKVPEGNNKLIISLVDNGANTEIKVLPQQDSSNIEGLQQPILEKLEELLQ